jgi:hypothetical protein
VDDAVPHGVGAPKPVDRRVELQRVRLRLGRLEVLAADQVVVLAEEAQLQAARARIDD